MLQYNAISDAGQALTTDWKAQAAATGCRVFPIRISQDENGRWNKKPLLTDWPNAASTDVDRFDWTHANGFGIRTGDGLFAFDLDSYKRGCEADGWLAERGLNGPTRTHGTISGGQHRFFCLPLGANLGNRAGIVRGLDARGEGGFVAFGEGYSLIDASPPAMLSEAIWRELERHKTEREHVEFAEVDLTDDLRDRVTHLCQTTPCFNALMTSADGGTLSGDGRSGVLFSIAKAMKRCGFTPGEYAAVTMGMTVDARDHVIGQGRLGARALRRPWEAAGPSLADMLARMPEPPVVLPEAVGGKVVRLDPAKLQFDAEPPLEEREVIDPTELNATAVRFVRDYFMSPDRVITLQYWKADLYVWETTHWAVVTDAWLEDLLFHWFSKKVCAARVDKNGTTRLVNISPTIPFRRNYVKAIHAVVARASDAPVGWSSPGTWVSVRNGLLRMEDGALVDHSPHFFNTTRIDADWTTDATMDRMARYIIDTVVPEREQRGDVMNLPQVRQMQEMSGYILSGDTNLQKCFNLIGQRRCGKGTYVRLIKKVMPGQTASIRSSQLGEKYAMEGCIGKALLVIPDARISHTSDHQAIAETLLTTTGEDDVDVRRMHQTNWRGKTTVRVLILSNSVPQLRDEDGVLPSRFVYIQCPNTFYGREDTGLLDTLLEERDAFLRWAVLGWQRLQQQKRFTPSADDTRLRDLCFAKMDPVGTFIKQRMQVTGSAHDFVGIAEIYGAFKTFCAENDLPDLGENKLSRTITTLPYPITKKTAPDGSRRGFSGMCFPRI